jgi:magnesium-transporting ATPase (P-type)
MRHFGSHRRRPGKFGLVFIIITVVMTLLVMSLWNALIPELFGLKTISFWSALGLLILCRVLFGGMGMGPMMFKMARDNRQLHERWMNMSEEEKQAFFAMRHRRGHHRGWRCRGEEEMQGNNNEPVKPSDNA